MTSQKTFFAYQRFGYHVSVEHDEKHLVPEIWLHEYLISPIEINVNWLGS